MKRTDVQRAVDPDQDTMRPEYDFSEGVRGVTASRYAEGVNVVVIDPDVLDVFPDSLAVNQALRALAPVLRQARLSRGKSAHRVTAPQPR